MFSLSSLATVELRIIPSLNICPQCRGSCPAMPDSLGICVKHKPQDKKPRFSSCLVLVERVNFIAVGLMVHDFFGQKTGKRLSDSLGGAGNAPHGKAGQAVVVYLPGAIPLWNDGTRRCPRAGEIKGAHGGQIVHRLY
jgi:hypothetical protein